MVKRYRPGMNTANYSPEEIRKKLRSEDLDAYQTVDETGGKQKTKKKKKRGMVESGKDQAQI